jgi:phosphatidate cytidylyltransferase
MLLALPFAGFALAGAVIFLVAAGEWANMSGIAQRWQQGVYVLAVAIVMAVLYFSHAYQSRVFLCAVLLLSLLGWLCALLLVCRYPAIKQWNQNKLLLLIGFWLFVPAWLGLLFLQPLVAHSGLVWWVVAVIALADIGAYFAGRRFGRRKLAVHVSPGKTWEGFWGGTAANFLFAILLAVYFDLSVRQSIGFVIAILCVSFASVLGDLFESMVKRERDMKDSSQLLPGHGGVLDRIDGWTAAVPVFALLYLLGAVL